MGLGRRSESEFGDLGAGSDAKGWTPVAGAFVDIEQRTADGVEARTVGLIEDHQRAEGGELAAMCVPGELKVHTALAGFLNGFWKVFWNFIGGKILYLRW